MSQRLSKINKCTLFGLWLFLLFCFELRAKPQSLKYSSVKIIHSLGDHYYHKQDYALAQIEYERALNMALSHKLRAKQKAALESKFALSLLHQDKIAQSIEVLEGKHSFDHLYLSMFAALRLGRISHALRKQGRILASPETNAKQKDQALLLGGSVSIEQRDYLQTQRFYTKLQRASKDQDVRYKSGRLLSALARYRGQPRKSPWIAGSLAALVPGSGHIYTKHYTDGLIAFFFNLAFLGSALVLYDLERETGRPHYASVGMALVGLNFYAANLGGAVQSAYRYNNFKERQFHQDLRDSFFNLKYIEKVLHF